jgi:hypothetical protein
MIVTIMISEIRFLLWYPYISMYQPKIAPVTIKTSNMLINDMFEIYYCFIIKDKPL